MPLLQKKKKKNLWANKSPKPNFKEELISKFSNSSKQQKRRGCFQLILQSQPWYKTRQRWRKERKWHINTTSALRCKNSRQNIGEPNLTIHDKDHTPLSIGIYSRDARVAPHSEVNQGNIPTTLTKLSIKITWLPQWTQKEHLTKFNIYLWLKKLSTVSIDVM